MVLVEDLGDVQGVEVRDRGDRVLHLLHEARDGLLGRSPMRRYDLENDWEGGKSLRERYPLTVRPRSAAPAITLFGASEAR